MANTRGVVFGGDYYPATGFEELGNGEDGRKVRTW
jgi:hypothetical protein